MKKESLEPCLELLELSWHISWTLESIGPLEIWREIQFAANFPDAFAQQS